MSDLLLAGPWQHRMVHAHGQRLHIAQCEPSRGSASAPLVLFLHGSTGGWFEWCDVLTELAGGNSGAPNPDSAQDARDAHNPTPALDAHLVAVSLRGYPPSDRTPQGYSPTLAADDIASLIRALGHTEALLVGQGMGAWIAWTLQAQHPTLVRGIIATAAAHPATFLSELWRQPFSAESRELIGTSLSTPGRTITRLPSPKRLGKKILQPAQAQQELIDDMVAHSLARCAPIDGVDFADTERGKNLGELMHASSSAGGITTAVEYANWWAKPGPQRIMKWLSKLSEAPLPEAILIAGSLDSTAPQRLLEASIPAEGNSQIVIAPDVGHFPALETPHTVADMVRQQLAQS